MTEAHELELPRLSSSEEVSFKNCRLGHLFGYTLSYGPKVTNRKLAVGIGFHAALEAKYTGADLYEQLDIIEAWGEERQAELNHEGQMTPTEWSDFQADMALLPEMVKGYNDWEAHEQLDEGYTTVAVEEKHYVKIEGAATLLPIKLDLLQRNDRTGRLRIVDFKTRASFSSDTFGYQVAEQTGNYQLGITAVYGERPTEVVYREARKMSPVTNPRSKPPYFREVNVVLTREEMIARLEEYVKVSHEVTDPERLIYANPGACCGSWKNDWQLPCGLVHAGKDPLEALEAFPSKYQPINPNARYDEETA